VDRAEWLARTRQAAERRYDQLHAPVYDQREWAVISPSHRHWVERLEASCPPGGRVLDAACGTGKYFGMVLDAGRRVLGTDQSAGMLARAAARYPGVPLAKVGLQELALDGEVSAAMCVDAMEQVFPEDWPLVLANLRRAVRPGGHLYLTVELLDAAGQAAAYERARAQGLPVVPGEDAGPTGGYHYHPPARQVGAWLAEAGLAVVDQGEGDDYWHLLLARGDG
jgi:SAM-dependent methyltransferase